MIDVRCILADEGSLLREVRLAALANAPGAFLETLDEVAADSEDVWDARAASSTGEGDALIMLALHE
ncbi:MAG: N-acetyltransferase, partial [Thermoleophilia bacterium]